MKTNILCVNKVGVILSFYDGLFDTVYLLTFYLGLKFKHFYPFLYVETRPFCVTRSP